MRASIPKPGPRARLAASALLLALSLAFLWSAAGFVMPTRGLTHRAIEREHGLDPGPFAAEGAVDIEHPLGDPPHTLYWRATRQPGGYAVTLPGFSDSLDLLVPTEEAPLVCYAWFIPTSTDAELGIDGYRALILAAADDPEVARIDVRAGGLPDGDPGEADPMAWLDAHGVLASCTRETADGGLWSAVIDIAGADSGLTLCSLRAYAADGRLLCEFRSI